MVISFVLFEMLTDIDSALNVLANGGRETTGPEDMSREANATAPQLLKHHQGRAFKRHTVFLAAFGAFCMILSPFLFLASGKVLTRYVSELQALIDVLCESWA